MQLDTVGNTGSLSSVSGVGPTQTAADGCIASAGWPRGDEVLLQPSAKLAVGTPTPGSAGGTAGNDDIQLTLTAGQTASDYNFAILGDQTDLISIRMYLAWTGTLSQYLTSSSMHTAASVTEATSGPTTYTSGGSGLAIAAGDTIAAPTSPTLTSMTVTIGNPQDGTSEQLSATTTGTFLTSNYANGVLTVSGVDYLANYQTVLQSILYSDDASTVTAGDRTISVAVNDGTDASTAVTETVNVVQGVNVTPTVTGVTPSPARPAAAPVPR